jgi:hypothetical protein
VLDEDLFREFVRAFSRLRFPTAPDYCDRLMEEILGNDELRAFSEAADFAEVMHKSVMRGLLKYDVPLRRAYCKFCLSNDTLSWPDVKSRSVGMDHEGFANFASACSLVPRRTSRERCLELAAEVRAAFPLVANQEGEALLFPQFQMVLVRIAVEVRERSDKKDLPLADTLGELLREIGMHKTLGAPATPTATALTAAHLDAQEAEGESGKGGGEAHHTSTMQYVRQVLRQRMGQLFDEVHERAQEMPGNDSSSETARLLSAPKDTSSVEMRVRLPSRPVVIDDALPMPTLCPDSVEQLLEASLAHHNLGNHDDSLKFLEAARMQLDETEMRFAAADPTMQLLDRDQQERESRLLYKDAEMYVTLCTGNVCQSCGDDEQSLLHMMHGWVAACEFEDKDWEAVCVNSIGMLAYHHMRYDTAALCFNAVEHFRTQTYGAESSDSATAASNLACCFYCLDMRNEARTRFEAAWTRISEALGHRSPRAVAAWKNLEKARRAQLASSPNKPHTHAAHAAHVARTHAHAHLHH